MGKIESGILGGFQGKVGTVIGTVRNGKAFMRLYRSTIRVSKSIPALTVRSKFSMVGDLMKSISGMHRAVYSDTESPWFWYAQSKGAIIKNATEGTYPSVSINFAKIAFSNGTGTIMDGFSGTVTPNTREVTLNWECDDHYEDITQNDKVIFIALNSQTKKVWRHELTETRSAQTSIQMLPEYLGTGIIHLYAYTCSPTKDTITGRHRISPSVFGGTVTLN